MLGRAVEERGIEVSRGGVGEDAAYPLDGGGQFLAFRGVQQLCQLLQSLLGPGRCVDQISDRADAGGWVTLLRRR